MEGALFLRSETLVRMTQCRLVDGIHAPRAGVGIGLFAETTPGGLTALGHSGAYNAKMFFEPAHAAFVCGTVNQRLGVPYYWWAAFLDVLNEVRLSV